MGPVAVHYSERSAPCTASAERAPKSASRGGLVGAAAPSAPRRPRASKASGRREERHSSPRRPPVRRGSARRCGGGSASAAGGGGAERSCARSISAAPAARTDLRRHARLRSRSRGFAEPASVTCSVHPPTTMRRAPVLLLAALCPTSAAIVADVSQWLRGRRPVQELHLGGERAQQVLARHRGEQLAQQRARVELRWAQAVSVEKVFQATLLPQTEGSVATFLLPDHTSYESSEGSFTGWAARPSWRCRW